MKPTRVQRIIAVILSALLLVTAAPVAAFAEGEAVTGDYYQLVTDVSQMVGGARYLIASAWEYYVLDGSLGEDMDSANNHIEVDFDGDRIAANAELDAASFEIDPDAGTIRSVSGYYIGSHDSQNKLLTSTTSDFVNEISFDDGDFVVGHQGTASHFSLHFNNDSGQKRFRFFKNDGQDPIQLYMRVDAPVSYVNAQGEAQEPIADYTTLDRSVTEWTNGWYVLKNDVTYPGRIAVKGDNVNLILCDGRTMNAVNGIFIREGYALTIWAQEAGTGKLIATGTTANGSAGIGSSSESGIEWIDNFHRIKIHTGDLTINGGMIEATGARHCAGIGGGADRESGNITINGGNVTAIGGEGAAGIGGADGAGARTTVINGGTVTATGGSHGAGIGGGDRNGCGTIRINGGTVTANAGFNASAIGPGYCGSGGTIRIYGGIVDATGGDDPMYSIGGGGCKTYWSYEEPGYDMQIKTKRGGGEFKWYKPFRRLEDPYNAFGYSLFGPNMNGTFFPKTAGAWTVSFDKNGGTGSMGSKTLPGGTFTLPACSFTAPSEEMPFVCWGVKVGSSDPVGLQPGETVLITANTTVKAIWKTEHTVSFENGGGSGSMNAETVSAYDSFTLPENGFNAPTGRHFYGWGVSVGDGDPVTMQPGDTLLVTDNAAVQALWTVSITSWAGLQTAIDNAQDGDTVALGQSLTAQSGDLRLLVSGKAITLDLNGYTLDRAQSAASLLGGVFTVAPGASLTVCDSGEGGTGTITGGYADKGGAFYNDGTLIIEGGAITDNHVSHENNENRGGAIYNKGTLIIKNCTISGNDGDDGGAIFNTADGSAELTNVTISNNISVNHGGGAIVNYGALTLQNCTVTGNTSKSNGGAIWTNAGGSAVTITNTTIKNNSTSNDDTRGGAIYIESGSVAVTGGKIADNTAKDGGAVFNNASGTLNLTDVFVHSNKSTQRGGGSITNYGTATLTDCDVWDNEAKTNGGAIWTGGSQADVTLTNCVVTGNTAELTGGGICLYQGTLTASGTTVSSNQSAGGAGMYIHENGTAILGGDGNLFYWNESSANGGGIANKGNLQIASLFNAQANSAAGYGGGVWNDGSMSVKDIVIIWENSSDLFGKDVYLSEGKVVTLNGELNFSTIGVDAEEPDQFITSGWYAWQRNASPESVFKAPEYHAVYLPDGATELKLKKTDDYPYNAEATVWATDTDRSTYRTGVNYKIHNLTSGTSRRFDGTAVSQYGTYGGITRRTRQGDSTYGVTGSSVATLEIDRSVLDRVEQSGMCIEYSPFFFTSTGDVRWGVELFPYSDEAPQNLGDVTNNVGENAYNTVTLTGSGNGSYTYQLRYGSVDGELRCAETCNGNFASDGAVPAGNDYSYGPYYWYITGDAPAAGESVTLRIAAICCAKSIDSGMYMLTEWTDVTITGTCSHANGHLQAFAANEPTCTMSGNSAYWKCDVCGKYFSDADAENEIPEESTIVPATGHSYAEPAAEDWTWTRSGDTYTAEVTVTCQNSDDVQTLTAAVEKAVAADGTAIYTATATVGEGDDTQTFTAVKPTVYYSISGYEDGLGNTVTADKETAAEGQTVTLTASAVDGYGLKALTVTSGEDSVGLTAGDAGTFTFTMPDGDVTVTAEFAVNYTVAVVTDGHGTVTADKPLAFEGDTVTLTVAPDTHYKLDTLTVTDGGGETIEITNNVFVMPAGNVTVTVSFYETYEIYVGGVQVTSKNKADVLGDGAVAYDGTQTEGTLTLNDAVVTGYYEDYAKHNIFVFNNDLKLTILLRGENSVGDGSAGYGVDLYCAGVTFTGDGSLTVNAAEEALYTHRCPVLIDGTTLTVRAGNLFGMEINTGDLTIRSSEIIAESNNYMAICGNKVEITNSSVTAVSNRSSSYALFGSKGVSIINSSVVANSPKGDGIRSGYDGELIITGSTVTATSEEYSGLAGYRGCTITDSVVEATGKYQGVCFSGAFTVEGDSKVTISNLKPGYAAVLTGSLNIGEGLAISTPQNAVINDYQGNLLVYKTVREADGTTLADKVVIERLYTVTVAGTDNGEVTADRETAFEGDTVTLTISPDAGYTLASLTVETGSGETVAVTDNTFAMPADDVEITAAFACPHASYALTGWEWAENYESATATFACGVCGDTVRLTDNTPVKTQVSAATTTADEVICYTATVTFDEQTYTDNTGNITVPGTADQAAADAVEALIDAIGTVEYTDACKAKINEASDAFDALTDAQKALVTNAQKLTDAIARYAELKAAADQAADQAAADEVIAKINAIGTVEYTDACKAKIDEASDAFDALTDAQKALVTNAQKLTDAIARYAELKAAADQAADQAAADEVIAKINVIGEVEYTDACKAKIDEARSAYDSLTGKQKERVTNYDKLTSAEKRYADLKAEAEKPDEPSQDDGLCKWCGKDHSVNFWQKIVGFFHRIFYFFAHLFGAR